MVRAIKSDRGIIRLPAYQHEALRRLSRAISKLIQELFRGPTIAGQFGLTHERIRQLESRAI
jgi:DNA-directed RNA polymerase sigma subunit (sigma70/sigma32)